MATYFGHKTKNRIGLRNPGVTYGPPAPYPYQRNRPASQDLRGPASSGNPKYLEQRGGQTGFQQFRPGQSLPGYKPGSHTPYPVQQGGWGNALAHAQKLQHLKHFRGALAAAGLTPQGLAFSIGLELLDQLDFHAPWAYQIPEQEQGYHFPDGGVGGCSGGPAGRNAIKWTTSNSGTHWENLCGTPLQVPNYSNGQAVQGGEMQPGVGYEVAIGPATLGGQRMTFGEVRYYPGDRTPPTPAWEPYRAPSALPLPRSAPPLPSVSETSQPAPSPNEYFEPYESPAIEISVGGGIRGPVAPVYTSHYQLPPGNNVRERKERMPASDIGRLIYRLYDATTEASEIVDILYDNLGEKCRGARDMSSKAYCVYRNLHTLDIPSAVADIVINHYEDKIWGRFYSYGRPAPFGSQMPGGTMPRIQLSQRYGS